MVIVAQLVRAPVCGTGGRRFEPGLSPQGNGTRLMAGFLLPLPFHPLFQTKTPMNRLDINGFLATFGVNWLILGSNAEILFGAGADGPLI